MSYKNHVFVIVGRKGGYNNFIDYQLPHYQEWGDNWVIIDGWAGAMGYEVVYRGTNGYPYRGMLHPIKLIMQKEEKPE